MLVTVENAKNTVTLVIMPSKIVAQYDYDLGVNIIVKRDCWEFNGVSRNWELMIHHYRGTHQDRISDIGLQLLHAGYSVLFPDEPSARNALAGSFIPRQKRWILGVTGTDYDGYINLFYDFDGKSSSRNSFRERAKSLRGAFYHAYSILINPQHHWDVIRDFAQIESCSISERAEGLLKQAEAVYKSALHIPVHCLPPLPTYIPLAESVIISIDTSGVAAHLRDE